MPIVIRHNGALNNITEGLVKGFQQGEELAAQKAAIEEAKRRRALEERRVALAESGQKLDETLAKSKEAFDESQRAYTQKVQGQQQEDRTRLAGEREAAQAGNALALGRVQQGAPDRLGLGPAMARGGAQGGPLGAALSGAMFTAQDQAAMSEAQQVARHMDPDRGAQYVKDEEARIRKARSDQMRPKLLKAWQDTLKQAQTADPNDPAASVMADPKIVGRAQAAITALQAGADPEPFAQQFSVQAQDIQEKRLAVRTNALHARQIEGRIATAQQEADTTLDEGRAMDLNDRIAEAQSYLDSINDPALEPVDARAAYTKAMAALHGRGRTSTAAKEKKSLYEQARKLAQGDMQGQVVAPDKYASTLDALTTRHLKELQDEAGAQAAPRAPAVGAQGPVLPRTGGPLGGEPAGAQGSPAPPPAEPVIPGTPEEAAGAPAEIRMQAVSRAQLQLVRAKAMLDQQPDGPEKDAALARLKAEAAKWLKVQGNDPDAPAPGQEPAAPAASPEAKTKKAGQPTIGRFK